MKLLNISRYSATGFIALLGILHLINLDIDPSWQPVSEYALGPVGWLMNIAFLLLGASFLGLGYYFIKNIPGLGVKIGGWLLMASSIGNFMAAICNTDPSGTTETQMTTSGQIHAIAAPLLGLMIIATLFILYQFYSQQALKQYKNRLLAATVLLWLLEIGLVVTLGVFLSKTNGVLTPETPVGWPGRAVIVWCACWTWICATLLIKAKKPVNKR